MKYLLAIVASFIAGVLVTAAGVPMKVHYVGHDQVASTMVKGGQIIGDNGLIVLANRAVQRGAEMHDKTNHIFIIVEGEATFVTGGKLATRKRSRQARRAPMASKAANRIISAKAT